MIKNNVNIFGFAFLVMAICLAAAGFLFVKDITGFIKTPCNPSDTGRLFLIEPGQSLATIAQNLETDSFISNSLYFTLFARYTKTDKKLQAGEYMVSASLSPEQILEVFLKGRVKLYRITIPEGMNIKEIASVVEMAGFCTQDRFMEICHDKSVIVSLGLSSVSLEGYLFPDTYFFPKHTACESIITTMVAHFNKIFTTEWQTRAKAMGFSVHDIVTLASIIEKETGNAGERPLISSVFHNRLKKNMRLESDPTIIYGIKDFDGNIKREHIDSPTPYNTYQIKGLPVGPIANPGALSLQAALNPVPSDYLFFVSKKDTTHHFSKTFQEHTKAVERYQLNKK